MCKWYLQQTPFLRDWSFIATCICRIKVIWQTCMSGGVSLLYIFQHLGTEASLLYVFCRKWIGVLWGFILWICTNTCIVQMLNGHLSKHQWSEVELHSTPVIVQHSSGWRCSSQTPANSPGCSGLSHPRGSGIRKDFTMISENNQGLFSTFEASCCGEVASTTKNIAWIWFLSRCCPEGLEV